MDGVVAAQPELLRELSSVPRQVCVDPYQEELVVRDLEVLERPGMGARRQTAGASGGG